MTPRLCVNSISLSHHPFGNEWFKGDDESEIGHQDSNSVRWDFQNKHLENAGIVTHFEGIPIEDGAELTFKVKWRSDAEKT